MRYLQRGHGQLSPELRRQCLLQLQGFLPEGHPEGQEPPVHLQERSVKKFSSRFGFNRSDQPGSTMVLLSE